MSVVVVDEVVVVVVAGDADEGGGGIVVTIDVSASGVMSIAGPITAISTMAGWSSVLVSVAPPATSTVPPGSTVVPTSSTTAPSATTANPGWRRATPARRRSATPDDASRRRASLASTVNVPSPGSAGTMANSIESGGGSRRPTTRLGHGDRRPGHTAFRAELSFCAAHEGTGSVRSGQQRRPLAAGQEKHRGRGIDRYLGSGEVVRRVRPGVRAALELDKALGDHGVRRERR